MHAQADPLAADSRGLTPLHTAAAAAEPDMLAALLAALPLERAEEAAAAAEAAGGVAAAAEKGMGGIARRVGVNSDANAQRITPLHMAAAAAAGEAGEAAAAAVRALLAAGADAGAADSGGNTPLHVAASRWGG